MNGKKDERAGQPPKSKTTVESYHDVEASREAYAAGESHAAGEATGYVAGEEATAGERVRRKVKEGPIPDLVRREREWLVGTAKERGRRFLSARMSSLAAVAHDISDVLHSSAQRLSTEEDATTAHYFDMAAEGVDKVATTLGSQDIETLVYRTRDFARSHPALFFGGMATAGFMVSRFLKSSPEEAWEPRGEWGREYGTEAGLDTSAACLGREEARQSRPYGTVEEPEFVI
jgi:hypothetical protein